MDSLYQFITHKTIVANFVDARKTEINMIRNKTVNRQRHAEGFDHFTIHYLTGELAPLEVVDADRPVREALVKMCGKEYSQLPVVQKNACVGAITLESVINQLVNEDRKGNRGIDFMDWPVKRFMDKNARFVRHEDDILKHVEWLAGRGFVIIGSSTKWKSVVTNYDLVHFFKDQTEVYLLLREIETSLRFVVSRTLGERRLKKALLSFRTKNGIKPSSISELTFDELKGFILRNWKELGFFVLDQVRFDRQLAMIIELRNRVFHFRSRISASELNSIRRLRDNYVNLATSLTDESKTAQV